MCAPVAADGASHTRANISVPLALRARRKKHAKPASSPTLERALDRDLAVERRDDAVADPESEPRSDADGLAGHERVEYPPDQFGGNPGSVVAHDDLDAPVSELARADVDLVALPVTLGNRLRRVHQQIQKHLPEARLVAHDGVTRAVALGELRAVLDLVPRQVDRAVHHPPDVHEIPSLDGAAARKRLQIVHDGSHALGPFAHPLEPE